MCMRYLFFIDAIGQKLLFIFFYLQKDKMYGLYIYHANPSSITFEIFILYYIYIFRTSLSKILSHSLFKKILI
jgi:hypothetical protein